MSVSSQVSDLHRRLRRLGWMGTLQLGLSRRFLRHLLPRFTTTLRPRGYRHPIHFRHGTTDKYVLHEVVVLEQYACVSELSNVRVIVDAGANIGSASVFLLNRYSDATLVAVEPDIGNFGVLKHNLSYYAPRARCVNKGLWGHAAQLNMVRGSFRDGGDWSFQVTETAQGQVGEIAATTIPELLRDNSFDHVDILKIDIEGAEQIVFRSNDLEWLRQIRTIAIELHDEDCQRAFFEAVAPFCSTVKRHGEVTIWHNPSSSQPYS